MFRSTLLIFITFISVSHQTINASATPTPLTPLQEIPKKLVISLTERSELIQNLIDHLNELVTLRQVPEHPNFYFDHALKILDKQIRRDDTCFYLRSSGLNTVTLRTALIKYGDFFSEYWIFGDQATLVGMQIINTNDSLSSSAHLFSWRDDLFYLHGSTLKSHLQKENPFEVRAIFLQYASNLAALKDQGVIQSPDELLARKLAKLPFSHLCNFLRFGKFFLSHYPRLQALDNCRCKYACAAQLKKMLTKRYSL